MAKFLTTTGTAAAVETLARSARERLILISPFIKLTTIVEDRLFDAVRGGVEVTVVCRESSLKPEEKEKILQLGRVRLLFLENLHAKCYCNEDAIIIGSLNLYEHSERHNREMSVRLSKTEDAEAFGEATAEVQSILSRATEYKPSTMARLTSIFAPKSVQKPASRGFCIRCADAIPYHPDRPLCRDCYKSWAVWENPEYEEKACHRCGDRHRTTIAKPLCYPCFRADAAMN